MNKRNITKINSEFSTHNSLYKRLGDYIQLVDKQNKDSKITLLRGVSTRKVFIESVANMTGVSLHNYKVIERNQFVYVADTSRRGEKIGLALNDSETCITSSIYIVFEVIDENELIPEYLFIWFNRSEFDRYARFNSWGSARETFDWGEMCRVKLPIPNLEKQKAIVTIYHTLETRKRINEQLKGSIKPLCPVLMRGVVKGMEREKVVE
jgi:type I restriction enzyme, S subunit